GLALLGYQPLLARDNSVADQSAAWIEKGNWDRAIADASQAIQLNATDAEAYTLRAKARAFRALWMHDRADAERAVTDCQEALRLNPSLTLARSYYGLAKALTGDSNHGLEACNEAIRLAPHSAEAYRVRGEVYDLRNEYAQAQKDYAEAIRLDPKNPWVFLSR